jgi:hypothetical protein
MGIGASHFPPYHRDHQREIYFCLLAVAGGLTVNSEDNARESRSPRPVPSQYGHEDDDQQGDDAEPLGFSFAERELKLETVLGHWCDSG